MLLKTRPLPTCILVITAILVSSCSIDPESIPGPDKYQISQITFDRSGSWGRLSGYKIVLHEDGTAEYFGDIHARRQGQYRAKISEYQFARLARVIIENDYFSLNDKYHALVTDTDTVTLSVVHAGGRKSVEDFGRGGGEKLTAIELAIDNMADQIVWVRYAN